MGARAGGGVIPTVVIPTRGDVDLAPVLASLPPEWPVVVWDNSDRDRDLRVYGRYAALAEVETEYVYTQDDDAICPAQLIADAFNPVTDRDRIVLNERDGETPWVAGGAIFHRDLPAAALERFIARYGMGDDVLWWADVIVAALTQWRNEWFGCESLDWHNDPNRMFMQPTHYTEQARVRRLCEEL